MEQTTYTEGLIIEAFNEIDHHFNFLRCQERTYGLIYYTVCSVSTTTMHRAGAGCWTLNCRPEQVLLDSCLYSSVKFIIVL